MRFFFWLYKLHPANNIFENVGLPPKFGNNPDKDYLEIHFYDLTTNILLDTVRFNVSDGQANGYIYKRVTPDQNDADELVVVVARLIEDGRMVLLPAFYDVVVNFFSQEVGNLYTRPLQITQVSDSRTELVVDFKDTNRDAATLREIKEFVDPSIRIEDLVALVKQLFRDAVLETVDEDEDIEASDIIAEFALQQPVNHEILFNSDNYANEAIIVEEEIARFLRQGNLNDKLPSVYYFMYQKLLQRVAAGDRRIQVDEFNQMANESVDLAFAEARSSFPITVDIT